MKKEELGFIEEKDFIEAVNSSFKKTARNDYDDRILKTFVYEYDKIIEHIAKKWTFGNSYEDLKSEIWLRVWKGIHTWIYEGKSFKIWLLSVCRNATIDYHINERPIRISRRACQEIKEYNKVMEILVEELQCNPTDYELSERLGWEQEKVTDICLLIDRIIISRLDSPISSEDDEEITIGELISDDSIERTYLKEEEDECIDGLLGNYRIAFDYKYILGYTLEEIADMLGITKSNANNFVSRARAEFIECIKKKGIVRD